MDRYLHKTMVSVASIQEFVMLEDKNFEENYYLRAQKYHSRASIFKKNWCLGLMFWAQVSLVPLDPPLLLAIMFCKGGTKPKILDLFADLQNKMHYLNDVHDLLGEGGKQMFIGFGDGMQGRSS